MDAFEEIAFQEKLFLYSSYYDWNDYSDEIFPLTSLPIGTIPGGIFWNGHSVWNLS